MGESMGGNSPGRRRNANKNMFPGRPADAPEPRRSKKLPKGVHGQSLGGGKARARKGQSKGSGGGSKSMVVMAVALLGVPATGILSAVSYVVYHHIAG